MEIYCVGFLHYLGNLSQMMLLGIMQLVQLQE